MKSEGHTCCFLDIKRAIDFSLQIGEKLKTFKPDIFGLKIFSREHLFVDRIFKLVKHIEPAVITIGGGPHVSSMPEKCMHSYLHMDYALIGEAEKGFSILLNTLPEKNKDLFCVPGLVFRKNGKIVCNSPEYVKDLDSIPFPDWESINPRLAESIIGSYAPSLPMISSRGCPYKCDFCASHSVSGKGVRVRSIENIFEEINYLHDKYRVEQISFIDDFFTANKKFLFEFLGNVKNLPFRLTWTTSCSLKLIDKETIKYMDDCGCVALSVGIESGSQRILDIMNKGLKVEEIAKKVKMIKKYSKNISLTGYFIIGYPEEGIEDIEHTIKFASKLPLDQISVQTLKVYPATPVYIRLTKEGKISDRELDWNNLGIDGIQYVPQGMTKRMLASKIRKFYFLFYLSNYRFIKILTRINNLQQFLYLLKRIIVRIFQNQKTPGKI